MQQTPFNKHLFLSIGQCLPFNYFNPPSFDGKLTDQLTCFRGGTSAENSEKLLFRRKMGGWVLEEIIERE